MNYKRRQFLRKGALASSGIILAPWMLQSCSGEQEKGGGSEEQAAASMFFSISLAQWSLHKALFGGELDNLDFAAKTKNDFGISAVEYVNQFFKDKATDTAYLDEMNKRAADNGVENVLIMIDGEGGLGNLDAAARQEAVNNHKKWVEAAKHLGCHSIRVNAYGEGDEAEVAKAASEGLASLSEFAKSYDINVIVENHGGPSSKGDWLAGVIAGTGMDNCGTLPDFGNFCVAYERDADGKYVGCGEMYDRYKGVTELMPYAKGVSAKSHVFDASGNETNTDYVQMLQIVKDAGYTGYIGIEYEGSELSEDKGIKATKKLLEKVGAQLA